MHNQTNPVEEWTQRVAVNLAALQESIRQLQIAVGLSPSAAFMAGFHAEPHFSLDEAEERAAVMESFDGLEQVDPGYWESVPDRTIDVWPVERPPLLSDADLIYMADASADGGEAL